jgi:hypothetical protein
MQNCSFVHHSNYTVDAVEDYVQNSGGSKNFTDQGSSDGDLVVSNEDFDDVYDGSSDNGSGSGYYIPKYNYTKYNYSNYHGNQNNGNGNADGEDFSAAEDSSGNDNGESGSDQSGQQDSDNVYSEGEYAEDYDPYASFRIDQCDTYERLWIWDLALSCKNDQLLDSCQCKFASQLMNQDMLSCSDMSQCPKDCQVCKTCLQLLGCDDNASRLSSFWWIILAAAIVACCCYCCVIAFRRRRDQQKEEKGYLGVRLMSADDASSTSGGSTGRSRSPLLGSPLSSPESSPPSSPIWVAPSIPERTTSASNDIRSAEAIDKLAAPTLKATGDVWLAPIPEISTSGSNEHSEPMDKIDTGARLSDPDANASSSETERTSTSDINVWLAPTSTTTEAKNIGAETVEDVDTSLVSDLGRNNVWLAPAVLAADSKKHTAESIEDATDSAVTSSDSECITCGIEGSISDVDSGKVWLAPTATSGEEHADSTAVSSEPSSNLESDSNDTNSSESTIHQSACDSAVSDTWSHDAPIDTSSDEIEAVDDSCARSKEEVILTDNDVAAIYDTLDEIDNIEPHHLPSKEFNESDGDDAIDYSTDAQAQSDTTTSCEIEEAETGTKVIKRFEW